ncbi:substrate-binding domain-containing protein [Catenulispora pinisilvae]|uniref:substrate-binding domain-containing protein n=1 Tax=Catenulispora pinisilvae TaxID=2705253 RepID=UPI0018921F54|nr:substrate-binding domain-containing protein [Catenulispora pinisilvae]
MGYRVRKHLLSAVLVAAVFTMSACGTNSSGASTASPSGTSAAGGSAAVALQGSIAFNDDKLAELRDKIKAALAGKDLSKVDNAIVVNVVSAYWDAAKTGAEKGASELGVKSTFQEPPTEDVTLQLSMINTLVSQGVTGFSVSAIQPAAMGGAVAAAAARGVGILPIDGPMQQYQSAAPVYLGTPNYAAGQQAGSVMARMLPNGGDVALLTGSLTATNATQRIAGFKDAIKDTKIKVFQVYNDNGDAGVALQNASAAMQADPNLKAFYTVWSYDGPSAGQAVQSAGQAGKVQILADDSEPKTLQMLKSGVIQAMVLQQPYRQGYMAEYILTATKVLGQAATMALLKPYLESDGYTLSSGIGVVTAANLDAYDAKLASFGLASS